MGSRRGSEDYDDLSLEGANNMGELIIDDGDPYDDDLLDPNPQQTKIEQIIQDMSIPDDEISGAGEEEELPHAERRHDEHDDMDGIVERLNSGLNRPHFPVVSLPSLDQSANNTPRVSYGFGLSQYLPSAHATSHQRAKNHHSRSSGLIKDMVKEDSREENHRGSSGPRDEVSREDFRMVHPNLKRPNMNSPAIGQRLREKEQQAQLQMYERDIQLLQERIRSLQNDLERAETARQDALDWREMRDAATDSSLEALRGRILTKAIEERDRANRAKQQSEIAVHELESELIKFQTENEAIRSAAESELQEVEDAYNRAQAAADGYRLSESEAREELDLSRKENLKLQRQLEGILQKMHNQEDQVRMAQSMMNEHSIREEEFRHKIAEKDQQIHKLARSLESLQLTAEGMHLNKAQLQGQQGRSKLDPTQGEDSSEQIDALNWQIYDLKRQLAAKQPTKQSHSTEVETKDHGSSCSLLEDFYIQFTQKILEVHGLAEAGAEPSLREVHIIQNE